MQKMSGRICDSCRKMFYPGDTVVEMCVECANIVWCIINIYENGNRELSSIHRTEERAQAWLKSSQEILDKLHNQFDDNKIIKREICSYCVL